ncbi:MAG: UDP-N-acetylglucosamine 2-epimerase, partial [Acidimicrobiales bacterium]
MIDALVAMEPRFRAVGAAERYGLRKDDYLLVTLHRPALVDGPLLPKVIDELTNVARELPVLFPVHPRTRKMLTSAADSPGLILTGPLSYVDFLAAEATAAAVLTDSGGVQEETTYLGIRCFTLRDSTERPVTIRLGTNTLLGLDPARIAHILPSLTIGRRCPATPPPLWDGLASERVTDTLEDVLVKPRVTARA